MRIALLGADDVTLAIAAAAAGGGQHRVVLAVDLGSHGDEIVRRIPGVQIVDDWERLLDTNSVDAVVVAADKPAVRVDQLRRLVQLGIPMVVSHPICLSMLDCYEIDMIRSETRSAVLPYLPARWHPAAIQLQALLNEGQKSTVGGIEQVVFHRFLAQREREAVLRQFALDVDLLQFIAGAATNLHALGSPSESGGHANLGVQITCEHGIVCRWLVGPVESDPAGEITLIGPRGKAILWMPEGTQTWRLEMRPVGESKVIEFPAWDAPSVALEKLAALRDGKEVEPTWSEAARTVELAETIDVSLSRGRTIDLHKEEFTDIGTFKGTMASLGCGLLIAGMMLVVFVAMARMLAAQAGWNGVVQILDYWPYLLLAVLGIYLVLQLLVLIGKSPNLPNRQAEPDPQNATDRQDLAP